MLPANTFSKLGLPNFLCLLIETVVKHYWNSAFKYENTTRKLQKYVHYVIPHLPTMYPVARLCTYVQDIYKLLNKICTAMCKGKLKEFWKDLL